MNSGQRDDAESGQALQDFQRPIGRSNRSCRAALRPTRRTTENGDAFATIEDLLANTPAIKRPHPTLGLVVYPVSDTPLVVLYDFTDTELRVHFLFHKRASLNDLDPASAEW